LEQGGGLPVDFGGSMDTMPVNINDIEGTIIEALQTCYDPEIPVNIYELGLIYEV
jgi:metal-sulfur cluster biosynthetic enzyme